MPKIDLSKAPVRTGIDLLLDGRHGHTHKDGRRYG